MYENQQEKRERVILFAVTGGDEAACAASLRELAALTETAGGEVTASLMQNRDYPDPGTYLGKGKIEELREMLTLLEADTAICDDELSPAQIRNLEAALSCKVCDRTLLILDIFAARARTSEGKIQVELAQLRYRQAHLAGLGTSLSRLGGGIGTRGPGEKKLEIDRRRIAERIGALKQELGEVRRHREVIRAGRGKNGQLTAAIVGYTNAGKSTLLNVLTDAGVLEEDALFATLDPTTRRLDLPGGAGILLTDTVGFIRKLPHQLIDAFRSTLEETTLADILIHVVDASNPQAEQQMEVVYQTLESLHAGQKPVLTVFNKQDRTDGLVFLHDRHARREVKTSLKHRGGVEQLLSALEEMTLEQQIYIERLLPYAEAGLLAKIRQMGRLEAEEYEPEGVRIRAYVPRELYGRLLQAAGSPEP